MKPTISLKVLDNRKGKLPGCGHESMPVEDRTLACGCCSSLIPGRRSRMGKLNRSVCPKCATARQCTDCGESFTPRSNGGNGATYCASCYRLRSRAYKSSEPVLRIVECRWCFQPFAPYRSRQTMHSTCRGEAKRHFAIWSRLDSCVIPTCFDCGENTPWFPVGGNVRRCSKCAGGRRHASETKRRRIVRDGDSTIGWRSLGERDGWVCHICRKAVPTRPGTAHQPSGATVDHLVPIKDDGEHEWHNVALAHRSCNLKRLAGGEVQLRLTG